MNQEEKREHIGDLPQRYCVNCGHHFSFHRYVTRDEWDEYGFGNGKIPWICEHYDGCECVAFQPGRPV